MCQAVGWAGFCAYITTNYLYSTGGRWQATGIFNIVLFTLVGCPVCSHGLRAWMWRTGLVGLLPAKRIPRVAAAVVLIAVVLTAMTDVSLYFLNGPPWLRPSEFLSMVFGYSLGFGMWSAIYFGVQARRRQGEILTASRDAQLQALKAQLNPHFLFNSLNSLRSLIPEDPHRAATMVTGFSDLLRYSLASDRHHTVTLAQELAIVDEYINLERMRFDERLRFGTPSRPRRSRRESRRCSCRPWSRMRSSTASPTWRRRPRASSRSDGG